MLRKVLTKPQVPGEDEGWTSIIRPTHPWFNVDLGGLWRYRDLVYLFVRRDFVARYKQTILGPLWFFLQPLPMTIMFTIVFGKIARIPTDGIPHFIFYLSGSVCWGYFSACMTETSNTFIANANIFGKVYFPRLAVPVAIVISNIFKFMIQLGLFVGFLIYFLVRGSSVEPNVAVIAHHSHFLSRTGGAPFSSLMTRLLTGYAVRRGEGIAGENH